jgi:hypothetical protein
MSEFMKRILIALFCGFGWTAGAFPMIGGAAAAPDPKLLLLAGCVGAISYACGFSDGIHRKSATARKGSS